MNSQIALSTRILADGANSDVLHELRSIVDKPEILGTIVASLIRLEPHDSQLEKVQNVMTRLEAIANFDKEIGCCMMVHLLETAGNTIDAHDTCDGIALWLDSVRSSSIERHLRSVVGASSNPCAENSLMHCYGTT